MKPRTIPPILLILLTLTGCQSKNTSPEVISLHPSNLEIFSGPLEEILEVEKILPLETRPGALTAGIWGFAQSKSGILFRNKGNKSLLVFNEDGSFKTKIERVGKGPGDYVEVFGQDWIPSIDNKKDEIVLSDVYGKKLLFFSSDGEFISEVKIPFRIHQPAALSANLIACHLGRFGEIGLNNNKGYELIALNRQGEVVAEFFPYKNSISFELGAGFSQGLEPGKKTYYKQLDPTVYQIGSDLVADTLWKFDFGAFNPDTGRLFIPGREGIINLQNMSKSNPFLFITGMVQTSKNVLAAFYHNKRAYNNFISNKSKKILSIAADSLNRIGHWHDLPIDAPDWSYGESFIYSVSALGWKEMVDGLKEETKAYMRKNLPGFEQAEKIPEDDNPVLVYFRLKDF